MVSELEQANRLQGPAPMPAMGQPSCWLQGGATVLDLQGRILRINKRLAAWLETEAGDCPGRRIVDLLGEMHPEWRKFLQEKLDAAEEFQQHEFAGGEDRRVWYRIELVRGAKEIFLRLESILPPWNGLDEDLADERLTSEPARREMLTRLIQAEGQLQNLIQQWPGVVFRQRPDLSFHLVSPGIEVLTGIPASDWERKPHLFWQIVHELDVEGLQQQIRAAQHSGEFTSTTYRIRHAATGRIAYVLEYRKAIVSCTGAVKAYEGFWVDVTRQTLAERRLSSAAWKETLALLTMGLAHDFTNVMSGIHSLSESFLAHIEPEHPHREGLALIKQNSMQAGQLIHRIINLHRGKPGECNYFNLNEIIGELGDLVRKIVPRRIQVNLELSESTLPIYVDAIELRQVILNLTLNAVDAMPRGGKLTLRSQLFKEPPPSASAPATLPRLPVVCLSIKDTGCGIRRRYMKNLFDPFFTTKPVNKGSGLGLYNARLFLERFHGAISVQSEEGVGTTFFLWIPQADFTEAEQGSCAAATRSRQRQTLLLAGHPGEALEESVEFLRSHGYHVVVAMGRDGAVDLLQSSDYQFTGMIVLVEPDDSSFLSAIPEAREQNPSLKVVLRLSGRDRDEIESAVLKEADLVLSTGLSDVQVVERLKAVFDGTGEEQTV